MYRPKHEAPRLAPPALTWREQPLATRADRDRIRESSRALVRARWVVAS